MIRTWTSAVATLACSATNTTSRGSSSSGCASTSRRGENLGTCPGLGREAQPVLFTGEISRRAKVGAGIRGLYSYAYMKHKQVPMVEVLRAFPVPPESKNRTSCGLDFGDQRPLL